MESRFESLLVAARWVLAPIYLGLALLLVAFTAKFFQELLHLFVALPGLSEKELVLFALRLVDLVLVAGLVVMVMFSGYENFVSKIDADESLEKLAWLGKLDAGTLKIKVAAALVAISSIRLLEAYLNIAKVPNDKLLWLVIIHLTFVVSALMLGFLERMTVGKPVEHPEAR